MAIFTFITDGIQGISDFKIMVSEKTGQESRIRNTSTTISSYINDQIFWFIFFQRSERGSEKFSEMEAPVERIQIHKSYLAARIDP